MPVVTALMEGDGNYFDLIVFILDNVGMHIINTLSPVFLLIVLGVCLRKANFFNDDFVEGLTKLAFWVAMPCMLFYKIAISSYDFDVAGKTYLVFLFGILIAAAVSWTVSTLLRLKSIDAGTFVQCSLQGNLIFVGLAVIFYDIANTKPDNAEHLQTLAVIVVAFSIITNNFIAVTVLKISQHSFGIKSLIPIAKGVLGNPLIISSIAGIVYSSLFDTLPLTVSLACNALGSMAMPMALLAIGATLAQARMAGNFANASASAFIKIAIAPMAGFLFARLLGVSISSAELKIALILLASPTAVAAYILASRLGGNIRLSTAVIVISTILSIASLATVLALF